MSKNISSHYGHPRHLSRKEQEVLIIQEYLPHYRVPFFNLLHKELSSQGISLRLVFSPQNSEALIAGDDIAKKAKEKAGLLTTIQRKLLVSLNNHWKGLVVFFNISFRNTHIIVRQ